jgi:hypothetical protein
MVGQVPKVRDDRVVIPMNFQYGLRRASGLAGRPIRSKALVEGSGDWSEGGEAN